MTIFLRILIWQQIQRYSRCLRIQTLSHICCTIQHFKWIPLRIILIDKTEVSLTYPAPSFCGQNTTQPFYQILEVFSSSYPNICKKSEAVMPNPSILLPLSRLMTREYPTLINDHDWLQYWTIMPHQIVSGFQSNGVK